MGANLAAVMVKAGSAPASSTIPICGSRAGHPVLVSPDRWGAATDRPRPNMRGATACIHLRLLVTYGEARHAVRLNGYSAARVCALGSGDMPSAHL